MTVPTDETQTSSLFPSAIEEMKSKRPNHHVKLTTIGYNLTILHSNLNAKLELLPELYLKILEPSTEEDIVEETETANLFQNEGTLIL
ncbi:hypothetical protein P5673_029939 [Acropora cervicornis]|uniref:Uncharacterized protein n=1 Tax=Acropora cervicornis TaxID=6130 RepID=A0AAD9PUY4_ACRCE|nr:hypothetical protein P5673_029939 [Acropora cervicornis]